MAPRQISAHPRAGGDLLSRLRRMARRASFSNTIAMDPRFRGEERV
jgi:hypothetical protein